MEGIGMAKRKFLVEIHIEATVLIDDAVINAVDDNWRKAFYDIKTPEAIAAMVTKNMVVHNWSLSHMDGFADQPDKNAIVDEMEYKVTSSTEFK
jgi:hypothetical protein